MAAIEDTETRATVAQPESLIRSRSGALVAALTLATLATGLLQISLPLELRQLRASPNEIGLSLSMFGFGMFAFEWLWGVLADRAGYRAPLVISQMLFRVHRPAVSS
jgi:MFS family permease